MDGIWEDIHSTSEWGKYPSECVIRFMAKNYGFTGNDRSKVKVLDFGCGQGANTWYLSREGFDTYAFDGSKSAVVKTKKRLEEDHLAAEVLTAAGTEVNYPEDYFDAIIDNVCVYANRREEIEKMYHKIFRMLKSGGKLLTVCFGEETYGYESGEEIETNTYINIREGVLKDRGMTHIFHESELQDLLYEIGFSKVIMDWNKYSVNQKTVHQLICQAVK